MVDISIIVPCYKQAEYLAEALDSVLAQTYDNWECIIVNDGSPDNTEEVALKYVQKNSRFKHVQKENGGISSARNYGIKQAKGNYIVALDADDRLHPAYIEKCLKVFKSDNSFSVVYAEAEKFGFIIEKWKLEKYSFKKLLVTNMIYCSAMFKKTDWERVGGFNETNLKGPEDWEFWMNLLDDDSKVFRIDEVLFYYRIKEESRFVLTRHDDYERTNWQVFENRIEYFKKYYSSPQYSYLLNEKLQFENQQLQEKYGRLANSKWNRLGHKLNAWAKKLKLKT